MRIAAIAAAALILSGCATPARPGAGQVGGEPPAAEPAGDVAAAAPGWAARCEQGFAVDCRRLGRAHLLGAGVPADDRLAAALLMKGCEIGEPASCSDLGVLTLLGRGVTQDDAAGAALARRACQAGHALACSNLATLAVEGIDRPAPGPPGRDGPRLVRAFETACEAGAPEGCLNLGAAREQGALVARDLAGSARALQRGCQGGLPLACHRWALLAREAPAAAPGADLAALELRACRAGIAPACGSPGDGPGPVGPTTPSPRLVAERSSLALGIPGAGGFHPTDLAPRPGGPRRSRELLRRLPAGLLGGLPAPLRQRLQQDRPADDESRPDEPVELLLRLRRSQLATCLALERSSPAATELAAVFLVESSGRPGELRAATEPADPGLEACALEVLQGWSFPAPDAGVSGPYLVRFDFAAAPPGAAPRYPAAGLLRAALSEPGCLERNLRVPDGVRGVANAVTVKLAVDTAGRPMLFHALSPAPAALVAALEAAARACAFTPGTGEDGRPVALWLSLTVTLEGR